MREDSLNENLINSKFSRNTFLIEKEMEKFMTDHEGDMIITDIMLLEDMGYERKMINKVYILLKPQNMEAAIEYMTEVDGIYQHDFFESGNKSDNEKKICFICKRPKRFHINYVPDDNEDNTNIDNLEDESDLLIKNEKTSINLKINGLEINNICSVCYEDIEKEDIEFNYLPCGHICCTQCWVSYLKTLITEANVEAIKCVEYKCKQEIPEDFIMKHIKSDSKLVEKYKKFKFRASIFKDPNKKQCPETDCESYLEKDPLQKYVKCLNGHEYCFECLRKPHGTTTCDEYMEKEFMTWKNDKRVKKCPRCKIYTEKNEGCNHMTCTSCKYQWCWLCEENYTYGHYDRGKCRGFQFTKADNVEEATKLERPDDLPLLYDNINNNNNNNNLNNINNNNRLNNLNLNRNNNININRNENNCCFSINKIFPSCIKKVRHNMNINCGDMYLYIILMWFLGCLGFIYFTLFDSPCFDGVNKTFPLACLVILIGFFLFIPFHALFTVLITPFILICLVYPKFIKYIFLFLSMDVRF